jgi:hypothetical protein
MTHALIDPDNPEVIEVIKRELSCGNSMSAALRAGIEVSRSPHYVSGLTKLNFGREGKNRV